MTDPLSPEADALTIAGAVAARQVTAIAVVDVTTKMIPDVLTLPGLAYALALAAFAQGGPSLIHAGLGVVAGGLLIGETLALTGMVYDVLADVVIYLAMALVLLVRPRGLFGQEGMSEE